MRDVLKIAFVAAAVALPIGGLNYMFAMAGSTEGMQEKYGISAEVAEGLRSEKAIAAAGAASSVAFGFLFGLQFFRD